MNIRPLPAELQKKCQLESNEVPERIPEDLQHLKEWLSKQRHIHARTEDQWLVSFLRGCKYSLEKTKEKIDGYYTMRTLLPDFFSNRDPFDPEIQEILSQGISVPLKKPNGIDGEQIIFAKNGRQDPSKFKPATVFKVNFMILDILLNEDDNFAIAGQYSIQDLGAVTTDHLKYFQPTNMQKLMKCLQDGYPLRLKGSHILNVPSFFDTVMKMASPFMSEKLRNRIHIYTEDRLPELYKIISKDILPDEYGGKGGPLNQIAAEWKEKVESYRDWFKDDEQYRTDESKRPGKPKTTENVFGVEGSFRKLTVD